jgi:hypothetical protein
MNMNTNVTIHCDTTELDRVIAKLTEALHLMDRMETPAVNELALATAAAVTLTASPRRISRRRLLRWWLPK